MGVQLNIKDAETIRLAKELAGSSGETITATIRTALEREQRARAEKLEDALRFVQELSAEFMANLPPEWEGKTSKQIMDSIYDEDGLPL